VASQTRHGVERKHMRLIGSVPGKRFHVVFAISSNIHRNIPRRRYLVVMGK
jgi:hypothetical protein